MYGCGKDCLILIPFRLPQISSFSLSLKCFSSDSENCPALGIGPLLQFPHLLRAGPVRLTLLFLPLLPSSYQLLHGSLILFHWSGTPVFSQLGFCMHFCVWSCIPNISVERDVLHIHLFLRPSCFSNLMQLFKEDILLYHEFFNKSSICGNSLWLRYVSEVGRVEVKAEATPWEATMFGQRGQCTRSLLSVSLIRLSSLWEMCCF